MKKNKAFTLLELIVVVAIIGLLIAISVVFLRNAKEKSGDTEKIQAIAEMRKILQIYAVDNGGFPGSASALIDTDYVKTINKDILYTGRNNSGNICSSSVCASYHLAIPLANIGNPVLYSDSNSIDTIIDGTKDNCISGTASDPNLCYDIIP